jgi:predicted  nucleic acid-binding Zn-ribbon protein
MKKKGDDSLLTRSRFMHTNIHDQQPNGVDENPKRSIDHAEELEALKASISEKEELIRELELQLQKLEESIKKVRKSNQLNFITILSFSTNDFPRKQKQILTI